MLGLFGPRLPIEDEELEWQLATFKWLQLEFGDLAGRPLVLPTPASFPPSKRKGHERIEDLFGHVRRAAGMEEWPCELRAGAADRPIQLGPALLLKHEGVPAPCGTFQVTGEDGQARVVITYNPALADDPTAMIATLAHELGHYLMSTAATDPPGGWELHESIPTSRPSISASESSSPTAPAASPNSTTRRRAAGPPALRAISAKGRW